MFRTGFKHKRERLDNKSGLYATVQVPQCGESAAGGEWAWLKAAPPEWGIAVGGLESTGGPSAFRPKGRGTRGPRGHSSGMAAPMRLSKRVQSAKKSRRTSPVGAVDPGLGFAQSGSPAVECGFSNDWKSFSGRFWETKGTKGATKQGVDKECQTIMTISGNSSRRQLGQLQECLECRFADLNGWETGGMPT